VEVHYSVKQKKLGMETNVISVKSAYGKKCLPCKFLPPRASGAAPALHCQPTNRLCKYPVSTAAPSSCSSGPLPEQALQGIFWGGGERGCCLAEQAARSAAVLAG